MDTVSSKTALPNPPKQLFPLVRHFSCRLTPVLLRWPITPNQITIFSLFLGLAGAGFFIFSDWIIDIIGALLVSFSYILDNCDGEVARIKGLSSEFGAHLDDIVDSSVDTAFFVALGYGMRMETGEKIWLWLGLAAAAGAIIDFCIEQIKEARLKKQEGVKSRVEVAHTPDEPETTEDWIIYIFHELSRADFCLIILILAVFDMTWLLLPLAAVGAQIYWITDLSDRARNYHA
jgi:phosphatidylglycerophosphate synthase